jgi:hypothetical protein
MAERRSEVGISNREAPDEEARERHENPVRVEGEAADQGQEPQDAPAVQSSNKSGVRATAQKDDSARHTERTAPSSSKVQGAFGKESH